MPTRASGSDIRCSSSFLCQSERVEASGLALLREHTLPAIGLFDLRRELELSHPDLAAELRLSLSPLSRLELVAILEDDADGSSRPVRVGTVKSGSDGEPLRLRRSDRRS